MPLPSAFSCPPHDPLAVSSSSSVAAPSPSAPLQLSLLSALSYLPIPSLRYPPPAPLFLICMCYLLLRCLHARYAVLVISAVVLFSAPVVSLVAPFTSLLLPPDLTPPPPPPLGSCVRWLQAKGVRCWWKPPPPCPHPWWPHTLSAHKCFGGLHPSLLTPCMPRAGSAHCRFLYPFYVSLWAWSTVSPVASWPSLLPRYPTLAGSTAVPFGASNLYLWRSREPCLGLAPSVPEVFLIRVPALPLSAAVGAAAAPSLSRPSSLWRRRCLLAPWLLGWWGGFHPLPAPIHPTPALTHPRWSLWGFCPPGATLPLQGCW